MAWFQEHFVCKVDWNELRLNWVSKNYPASNNDSTLDILLAVFIRDCLPGSNFSRTSASCLQISYENLPSSLISHCATEELSSLWRVHSSRDDDSKMFSISIEMSHTQIAYLLSTGHPPRVLDLPSPSCSHSMSSYHKSSSMAFSSWVPSSLSRVG